VSGVEDGLQAVGDAMRVDLLTPDRDPEYTAFLDRLGSECPGVLGYHYPFNRDMLQEIGMGTALYFGAWSRGELVGVLPGFLRRSRSGAAYCSLPFFGPNAGVICNPHAGTAEESIHAALLGALLDHLSGVRDLLTAAFYTPFLFSRFDLYDRMMSDAVVVERETLYLFLPEAPSNGRSRRLFAAEPRPGVEVRTRVTPERVAEFYDVYLENCVASGIPIKPRRAVEAVMTHGSEAGRVRCYFAYHAGRMIAGLVAMWGPSTASYYIPCTRPDMRPLQPGTALAGRAVRDAAASGLRFWNWEGSPSRDSGVYRFKAKWGSTESAYRIYVRPYVPEEVFRTMGADRLAAEFPNVYVYPHARLLQPVG
jgi:hypothetical protein